jgi:uncharacterized coiled-coil DUF342 family protein
MKLVQNYKEFLNTINESKQSGYIQDCLDMIDGLNIKFSDTSSSMSTEEVDRFYSDMGKLTDKLNELRAQRSKFEKQVEELQSEISLLNAKRAYYANFISGNIASLKNPQYNHEGRLKDNDGFYEGLVKVDKQIKDKMDRIVDLSNELNKY